MNVYDFDGTIYKKDSSIELYKYVIKRKPFILPLCFSKQIVAIVKYKRAMITKEEMKEAYFCFLKYIDIDNILNQFVDSQIKFINKWYLKQRKSDDVIISASPAFLINKFADKINVKNVIASEVNIHSGKFNSLNCFGHQKVIRFKEQYPNETIHEFYSDSISDMPMAFLAENAFMVKKGNIVKWEIN